MAVLIGELDHLVLDRGAIARADADDLAAVKRRAADVVTNRLMEFLIRISDVTGNLALSDGPGPEGKRRRDFITRLLLEGLEVDRTSVESGRSAGLEPGDSEAEFAQILCEFN